MSRPVLGAWLATVAIGLAAAAQDATAQEIVGRDAALGLSFEPLEFRARAPEVHEVEGVTVLFLREPSVPLTTLFARFEGGYGLFDRRLYAAGSALPALLRYGGTRSMSPDSVDEALELYAIQTAFGGGGEAVFASLNTLTEHVETAIGLWGDMLREPRFDTAQVEVWRGRELESVRRRGDDPQRLAYGEFNRLLYGDHPVGWEMEEDDLTPERMAPDVLEDLHARIVCPENLVLGVTGDLPWSRIRPLLSDMLRDWRPCAGSLPESPVPDIRRGGGVFLIPKQLEQAVIVMAHPTHVRLGEDPTFFAAQIGNSILGAGGFSSRILSRVRTEEGYAYSASSLWTMPRRYDGIVGAVTRTRPENAAAAVKLILSIMEELRDDPPEPSEVETAVDRIVNGFVFNFESPAQIISRRMVYLAQELPADWLERYLRGVQSVTPEAVHAVLREHVRPAEMTILLVGDPDRMDRAELAGLGVVREIGPPG